MQILRWPRGESIATRWLITEDTDCANTERSFHSVLNVAVTMATKWKSIWEEVKLDVNCFIRVETITQNTRRTLVIEIHGIFSQACTVFGYFGISIPLCLLIDICFIIRKTQHFQHYAFI